MPAGLTVSAPLDGEDMITMDVRSRVPSMSESFAARSVTVSPPSATVSASSAATGGSLTSVIVMVTVAVLLVAASLSSIAEECRVGEDSVSSWW